MTDDRPRTTKPPPRRLTAAVASLRAWLSSLAVSRHDLAGDSVAGIPGAIGSVPDGMAASVLAGVRGIDVFAATDLIGGSSAAAYQAGVDWRESRATSPQG